MSVISNCAPPNVVAHRRARATDRERLSLCGLVFLVRTNRRRERERLRWKANAKQREARRNVSQPQRRFKVAGGADNLADVGDDGGGRRRRVMMPAGYRKLRARASHTLPTAEVRRRRATHGAPSNPYGERRAACALRMWLGQAAVLSPGRRRPPNLRLSHSDER